MRSLFYLHFKNTILFRHKIINFQKKDNFRASFTFLHFFFKFTLMDYGRTIFSNEYSNLHTKIAFKYVEMQQYKNHINIFSHY